jgi:hypothetical protein
MNRPPLRLARPGQLPAPAAGADSLQILTDAIDSPARQRTPAGSATPPSTCTPWPASSPRPTSPARSRPQRPRPGTHLNPDRRAPRHHRRHGSTPLPEQPVISLTTITRIMPLRGCRGAREVSMTVGGHAAQTQQNSRVIPQARSVEAASAASSSVRWLSACWIAI